MEIEIPNATKALVKLDARGNLCELTTRGFRILFSYGVPVAGESRAFGIMYRTNCEHLTRSMKRHITRWLEGREAKLLDQNILESALGLI